MHERLYSLGQLQLAKQQQAAAMRDEELSKQLQATASPDREAISARRASAPNDSKAEGEPAKERQERPLPPPGQADLQDPRVVRNVEDLKQLQERINKKAAEEEQRNKAEQDFKNKNKNVAQKMTLEKFNKDFEQVMADMKASEDWEEGQKINFEQTGSIMATLGFLPENVAPGKPDYALFEELWAIVDGEDRGGINKEDLSYVLQIVRGITLPEKEVDADAPEGKEGLSKQIVFNADGNLQIRKGG